MKSTNLDREPGYHAESPKRRNYRGLIPTLVSASAVMAIFSGETPVAQAASIKIPYEAPGFIARLVEPDFLVRQLPVASDKDAGKNFRLEQTGTCAGDCVAGDCAAGSSPDDLFSDCGDSSCYADLTGETMDPQELPEPVTPAR